ncbi:MAG: OmpA family protein [Saprospiraceae bacterium]
MFRFLKNTFLKDINGIIPDLDKLVQFLNDNPKANVELSAHTDSKGKASYNLTLSQGRANSAKVYIASKGIATSRITSKGYGETNFVKS